MNRRAFIVSSLSLVGAAGLGLVAYRGLEPDSDGARAPEDTSANRLHEQIAAACSGVSLEWGVIERYLDDLRAATRTRANPESPGSLEPRSLDPVRRFLMSLDLFDRPLGAERPVKYVGLYNPYRTVCRNPLHPSRPATEEG